MRKTNKEDLNDLDEDKSYFCSELAAHSYKMLGLLPQDIPASRYWPGSFSSEKKELPLLDNAELGEETVIDFSILI